MQTCSAPLAVLATSVAQHPLHLHTAGKQWWRRLRGRRLCWFAAASATGDRLAPPVTPPSRPLAGALEGPPLDRGVRPSPFCPALTTLLVRAGPLDLPLGPYGSRPITTEPLDCQRGSNRLYRP